MISHQEWGPGSDVWAFGVTLWEIFADGAEPYARQTDAEVKLTVEVMKCAALPTHGVCRALNVLLLPCYLEVVVWNMLASSCEGCESFCLLLWSSQVADMVLSGGRLPRPARCPRDVYGLMMHCWATDPQERPTFTDILATFRCAIALLPVLANLERATSVEPKNSLVWAGAFRTVITYACILQHSMYSRGAQASMCLLVAIVQSVEAGARSAGTDSSADARKRVNIAKSHLRTSLWQ